MTASDAQPAPRIDVFSLKGGVGKTTISWLLARYIAKKMQGPVLLIDADFTGTSLGDYLFPLPLVPWESTLNLAHLLSGEPERLGDWLGPKALPVWSLASCKKECSWSGRLADVQKDDVLFAPSSAESIGVAEYEAQLVEPDVLHALLAHEATGGWVGHVIERLITATMTFAAEQGRPLAAVIVDHSPGMGPVQQRAMFHQRGRKVLVCSLDHADLRMVRVFLGSGRLDRLRPLVFCNRTKDWSDAKSSWLQQRQQILDSSAWFRESIELAHDPGIEQATALAGVLDIPMGEAIDQAMNKIWEASAGGAQ